MKGLITVDHTLDDLKELLAKHAKLAQDRMSRMTAIVSASCGAVDSVSTETSGSSNTASASNSRQVPDDNSAPSQISTQPLSKKMKLLEKFRGVGHDVDLANKIGTEVNTYLHLEITNADENPLVFWKHQQHNFPFLSVLAKAYLSVSASSVPVEAMFSTSGLILNQKRSSMAPFRANMAFDDKVTVYLYADKEQGLRFTGRPLAFASPGERAVHQTMENTVGHELTHVVALGIGYAQVPLFGEGVAVWLDGDTDDLHHTRAADLLAAGKLPTLATLLDNFRDDESVTYPAAGSFCGFVIATCGLEAFRRVYVAPDPVASAPSTLGKSLETLDAEWRAFLRSRAK